MRRRPRLEALAAKVHRIMQQPEMQKELAEKRAKRPAELDEQWPAIRSYLDGDAGPLRTFIKKHIGPSAFSSFVLPALEKKDIGDLDEWETWEFIKHHKVKARSRILYQEIQEQAPALCSEIIKHRSGVQ